MKQVGYNNKNNRHLIDEFLIHGFHTTLILTLHTTNLYFLMFKYCILIIILQIITNVNQYKRCEHLATVFGM